MTAPAFDLAGVVSTYAGSDGDATKSLYAALERRGPAGVVALNVFRAVKNSARAKVYRGGQPGRGSYRSMAYDRKEWSIDNLVVMLREYGGVLGLRWGWGADPDTPVYSWILYVELPTGQVSFHLRRRGDGPDYAGAWDGVRDAAPGRICRWCALLLASGDVSAEAVT